MSTEIKKTNGNGNGDIRSMVLQMKAQFALALPKHVTPDRFTRVCLTAINRNPKLLSCTKESLLACLMDCSQFGLEPDGRKAHLIPYGSQCTLIVDYKGLVDLARRSGEVADIHADVVYENDTFEYSFGSEGKLVHKPTLQSKGKVIGAYSYVRLKDGSASYEVMSVEEIEAIRSRSKAGKSGPWVTDWAEMAKKTIFRRHTKWLPLSSEFQEVIEKDYDVPADITALDKTASTIEIEMPKPKKAAIEAPNTAPEAEPVINDHDINVPQQEEEPPAPVVCSSCGQGIPDAVEKYSIKKYGKRLCIDCQPEYKK